MSTKSACSFQLVSSLYPLQLNCFFVLQFLKLEKELMKVFKDEELEIVSNTIMALLFCECEHHTDS